MSFDINAESVTYIKHAIKFFNIIALVFELGNHLCISNVANYSWSLHSKYIQFNKLLFPPLMIFIFFLFFFFRDLSNNAIMSVQGNAFSQMKKLKEL